MKNLLILFAFQSALIISLNGQTVSNYTCKLDNGIVIKTEKCWNQVWVSQSFGNLNPADKAPLAINLRILGDLTSSSSFKLYSGAKEVKLQDAKPGTYTMKLNFKLSGKPGTLAFDIENVTIKAGSKTTISVTLYDFQYLIQETAGSQGGLSGYELKINRYKGVVEDDPLYGVPSFYMKGKHDTPVTPDKAISNKSGKIKPGSYDMAITLGVSGHTQRIWLENFTMKPDVSYVVTTNLNAGIITYAGVNKDVKAIHLYPAGTADKQSGNPAPDKNFELIKCDNQTLTCGCPPGTYDVLLNIKNGTKYEWRKNLVVQTGMRTGVK
ncbi:MAG: hypothetical protein ABSA76_01145 [Bacteroidales bacterium]